MDDKELRKLADINRSIGCFCLILALLLAFLVFAFISIMVKWESSSCA